MEFSVQQIADLIEGVVEGNKDAAVYSLSKIEEGKQGTLSFLSNPQYTSHIYKTQATAVIVSKDFIAEKNIKILSLRINKKE